jgi:DNA-binding HxlR family transcriptional regulator
MAASGIFERRHGATRQWRFDMAVSRKVNESHYDLGMGYCPSYHHAAELVGRRWNGVIIRALLLGATRFGEIAEQIPEMSDKMLANRLREL